MTAAPIRLLLLEDNPGDARLVQAALVDCAPGEFAVTTVERLADALARIRAGSCDAILCDLGLPDSAGLATAQAIATRAPSLPLVVLTGSQNEDLGREAIHLGAQDYLVKGKADGALIARALRYAIERKRLENEIRKANEVLEQRTAELTSAYNALEAFSYSVSHDLRAPLRSIDGFATLLEEDYAARFDDEGRDALRRVRGAAQRMGELIDDLLKLSRLTRVEMNVETTDLSALARSVAGDLAKTEPGRKVAFEIPPGLVVRGDKRLLLVLLENLLGNAWKYTGKHASARIELGVSESAGEPAYFVRDDGAGFDMAYVANLFVPFQRLHNVSDFPGTGIGLATVARIVQRHGGRVWAEGAVDKGAAFYFTLSN